MQITKRRPPQQTNANATFPLNNSHSQQPNKRQLRPERQRANQRDLLYLLGVQTDTHTGEHACNPPCVRECASGQGREVPSYLQQRFYSFRGRPDDVEGNCLQQQTAPLVSEKRQSVRWPAV